MGVLCSGCGDEASARGPRKGDYALAVKGQDGVEFDALKIEVGVEFGDEDSAYADNRDEVRVMDSSRLARLFALADAVRVHTLRASAPGTKAPVYRSATLMAVLCARKLVREWDRLQEQERIRRSLAATPPTVSRPTNDWRRDPYTPGTWTGD